MNTRTQHDYYQFIVMGTPLPELPDNEVELPQGFYVCLNCKQINNYFKSVCADCDAKNDLEETC